MSRRYRLDPGTPIRARSWAAHLRCVQERAKTIRRLSGVSRDEAARLAATAVPRCTHPDQHRPVHGAQSHRHRSALHRIWRDSLPEWLR